MGDIIVGSNNWPKLISKYHKNKKNQSDPTYHGINQSRDYKIEYLQIPLKDESQ